LKLRISFLTTIFYITALKISGSYSVKKYLSNSRKIIY